MNNQVAAPYCGSCKHYHYDEPRERFCCHNKKEILLHGMSFSERVCTSGSYNPRNPIPIIELPGVKRLMTSAYIKGLAEDPNDFLGDRLAHYQDMARKYMKALEAK